MWLRITLLSLLVCILLECVQSEIWTRHTVLDGDGIFHLSWNPPDDKRGDSEIVFKVEMKAKGYFGLGFSPNGGMPGSDIVTGWIKDGEIYFQDRHANAFSLPLKDDQQDYYMNKAYENDTFTVFEFRRKLDTCDENDWVIDESTMRVIYAYSEKDPETDDPFYHQENRGSKSVILLQENVVEGPDLNLTSLLQWDVTSPGIDFSSFDTLYWCKIYKSPEVSKKHHIIYVKPLIQEGNEKFVHHMAIYECVGGTPEEYEYLLDDRGHECYQHDIPIEMSRCGGLNANWAIGGHDIVLPEHVGMPIDAGPGKYYMFQVHYDNQQLLSAEIDHSGFRFYYTPNVRKYDAGTFSVGASLTLFIPPGQEEFVVAGHGSPECFTSLLPESGAKAIAIHLHAHLLARGMKVRHFRGNKELIPFYDDRHYDFNYQVYRFYTEEVTILPNDQITLECTYNSSERSNTTLGGLSTKEEMCLSHILYYPRVNKNVAQSGPSFETINKVLNTTLKSYEDILEVLGSYDWKTADIDEVQSAMRYSEQEAQCNLLPVKEDEGLPLISYPKDLIPYVPQSTCNITM